MPSGDSAYYDPARKEVHGPKRAKEGCDSRGIGNVIFEAMKKWKDEGLTAQICAATGDRDSFEDLLTRCVRTAMAMKELGIRRGDIISICSYNHLNSIVPFVAAYFVGAIAAPTDPTLAVEDTRHLLNLVRPALVFASEGSEPLIERALSRSEFDCEIVSFAETPAMHRPFAWFLEPRAGEEDFRPEERVEPEDVCLILFSSGTTGLPKGICLNHHFVMNCVWGSESLRDHVGTYLGYASLYWISAVMIVTSALYFGTQRLVCKAFEAEHIWELVEKYQVDFVFLAPVQAIQTIPHLTQKGRNLKMLLIGGGNIAPIYLQQLRDGLPDTFVASGYGQTEIGVISALPAKDENYEKLETCGQPVAGLTVKISDPDTDETLGLNRVGEIRIKTKYAMSGYYQRDSSDVWDAEGYMKTGDMGYFDDELYLFVTDRIKEMFKYMSWHIVPAKLEMILQSHPAVQLAVVIGVPHPTEDNHALGVVTLAPNAMVAPNELEKFVEARVDDRNRLRAGVIVLDEEQLPMTPSGKIMRRALKDVVLKQLRVRA